jgi:hypothetical protein
MIVSKLLLVIILSIGLAVFEGAGQSGDGAGQATTQLAAGSLILLMGGFTPWMAIKMFHFAGDTFHAAHLTVGQSTSGGRAVIAAPQKIGTLAWSASSITSAASRLGGATTTHRLTQSGTGSAVGGHAQGSSNPAPPKYQFPIRVADPHAQQLPAKTPNKPIDPPTNQHGGPRHG